jgi:hypothetical protein
VAGVEHKREVGMIHRLVEAQHVVAGGGQPAMVLQRHHHADFSAHLGAAPQRLGAVLEGLLGALGRRRRTDEHADERRAQVKAHLHGHARLLELGRNLRGVASEFGRDGEAGDRHAVIETGPAQLFQVGAIEPRQVVHVQIHPVQVQRARRADEAEQIHLSGAELILVAERQATQSHHGGVHLSFRVSTLYQSPFGLAC